jgi:tellurite resistance-related uncharacterized protein
VHRVPIWSRVGLVTFAWVDDADAELVEAYRWYCSHNGYAMSTARGRSTLRMHRLVMGIERGDCRQVDHINRDKMDNRRGNLRLVTPAQNCQNVPAHGGTSQHRGVHWNTRHGGWVALVVLNGRHHYLGLHDDELEAARVASDFRREHMPYSEVDQTIKLRLKETLR